MLLKIKNSIFRTNSATYETNVHFKKIYELYFDHFLIKRTVFVLIVKNVIKKQKFNFSDKLGDIKKKYLKIQNFCEKRIEFR